MTMPPFEQGEKLSALPGIAHGFFGRLSGIDGENLNVSDRFMHVPGDSARHRKAALAVLGMGNMPLAWLHQLHSNEVVTLASPPHAGIRPDADAIVTKLHGVALGILTADCAAILLADPQASVIGAAHAGWRGAVTGMLGATVSAMAALGAAPQRITAAIGPTISMPNYEVGPDFVAEAVAHNPHAAARVVTPQGSPRPHFDLPGFIADDLRRAGIQHIDTLGICTYAAADRYFSHRHTTHHGTERGRQIALIAQK